jgi:hypothetical protein
MDQSVLTKKDCKHRGKLMANAEKQEGKKFKQSHGSRAKFWRDHEPDMSKPWIPSESLG